MYQVLSLVHVKHHRKQALRAVDEDEVPDADAGGVSHKVFASHEGCAFMRQMHDHILTAHQSITNRTIR